jgi:hypothetical protein
MTASAKSDRTLPAGKPYRGRRATLATMHGKALGIAPPLLEHLGMIVEVPESLDTDSLGTFTGEIPRSGTMKQTAIAKARLGMARSSLALGIASEGSFGPHPLVPFLPVAQELIILVDDERGLIISETLMSTRTNFNHLVPGRGENVDSFLQRIGFPAHAVIVRPNDGTDPIRKGVVDPIALQEAIKAAAGCSADGSARIETDMRAHLNPTRMNEIGRLATKFAQRLACQCPACGAPGFGVVRTEAGLPCADCGAETLLVNTVISGCVSCDHSERQPRTDGRLFARAAECPECNP